MNKLFLFLLASMFSASVLGQPYKRRLHPENTDKKYEVYDAEARKRAGIGKLENAGLPNVGSPKIPVILVQFADTLFKVGKTSEEVNKVYEDFFNLKEGNARPSRGSVYQYFKEQSYGQFTPEFEIIGPVTLSRSYKYYGEQSGSVNDKNIDKFYSEACKLAMTNYSVKWETFDNNNDGAVDMVFFIYAGEGQNYTDEFDKNTIWPKEGWRNFSVTVDNTVIKFGAYGCTSECCNYVIDGIGTACHELSHGLGLPDAYDTNYVGFGMDYWSIMDSGSYQIGGGAPCGYTAYERDFMGWRKLEVLDIDKPYSLEIEPIETTGKGYKLVNKANPNEYFILENRQNIGYDGYLCWNNEARYRLYGPNHGLMITHIDYSESVWTSNDVNTDANHQRYTIVPADKELICQPPSATVTEWANSLRGDLYPGLNNVTEMSSYSTFAGKTLGATVTNIREVDGIIKLDINGGTIVPALKDSLAGVIAETVKYDGKKMNADISAALAKAVVDSESAPATEDGQKTAIKNIHDAAAAVEASIAMYDSIASVIAEIETMGDAAKASFAESGIKSAYDNGTISSLDVVTAAYNKAVADQDIANGISTPVTLGVEEVIGLDGVMRSGLVKGINVVKKANGNIEKKLVK